jgi:serine/threonine-protein kinase HipA
VISVPVARSGERYLLKLNPIGEYPNLVDNEAFFLAVAGKSGLRVPPASLVTDSEGAHGLLVQRFDRVTVDGQLATLAVEDGCQAADRPPADKYLLGAERVTAALVSLCDAPIVAGRELIRQLAFAYLTGNGDAHAKNFSVLQDPTGEWMVSPAYDVPCSYVYGDHTMALSIGGRGGEDFGFKDFAALGASLGVPERAIRRAVTELLERTDLWLTDVDELPFDSGVLAKLKRVIKHRRMRLSPG